MKNFASTIQLLLCIAWVHANPRQVGRLAAAGLTDREAETFFISFRDASSAGRQKKVATLISYPVKVTQSHEGTSNE